MFSSASLWMAFMMRITAAITKIRSNNRSHRLRYQSPFDSNITFEHTFRTKSDSIVKQFSSNTLKSHCDRVHEMFRSTLLPLSFCTASVQQQFFVCEDVLFLRFVFKRFCFIPYALIPEKRSSLSSFSVLFCTAYWLKWNNEHRRAKCKRQQLKKSFCFLFTFLCSRAVGRLAWSIVSYISFL